MTNTPSATAETREIGPKEFWQVLGERAMGMTLVTATGSNGPAGFVALSAAHVSASPPTLLVSVDHKTSARERILESRHFAINYLAKGQEDLGTLFGRRTEEHDQRFASPDWGVLKTGAPVLTSALGCFDCALEDVVERGTTTIAIGRVVAWFAKGEGEPLVFFRGKYWP
jgi:flavin reductase (DIM6/NTAB) family NADH-FMN oxidoreductase RutF